MAEINFFADLGTTPISNINGSGLGFFGGSFGQSVELDTWQTATFITDGQGQTQGPAVKNVQYLNVASGICNGASEGTGLQYIPNKEATLNIRFTDSSPRLVTNAEVRIFDRVNIDHPASGVRTRIAELIHPSDLLTVIGSGDAKWWGAPGMNGDDPPRFPTYNGSPNQSERLAKNVHDEYTVGGSGLAVPLSSSPGVSGFYAGNGAEGQSDTTHDWYLALSASPILIGNRTQYSLYMSLEYS